MRRLAALPAALLCIVALVVPAGAQQAPRHDELSERIQQARGLYITAPYVRVNGARGVVRIIRSSAMDAAVLDLKDATGRVNYDSAIPELQEQETRLHGDVRALVQTLHENGIVAIARIVCFNDPVLAHRMPDRAIQDVRAHRRGRTRVWTSWGTGGAWLDPWDTRNHDLVISVAREAEALGFDEIQLDYIRFPVDDGVPYAHYPHEQQDVRRRDMLHAFLGRLDDAVRIPVGVDVFGIQAYWEGDSSGLGQDLSLWTDVVDVYSPMLYLNAMRDWERGTQDRARRLVQIGVQRMRQRLGPRPVIRPFLQAFEQEAEDWGPRFIANQIQGARRGGSDGFLFWHPGSNYGTVQRAMQGIAHSLSPFPIPEDRTRARVGFGG
ncbi:putative glycoside hydrolase [Sandaracinus amylolyticus]|uniref:Putative glycoside hydrolase n=1 Tax=Sandaracinus amylolyticus TaxID=927083 RepID=A0A0F6YKN1_9BACT|nr:putative glycoside hydrolase [Sandaracinus amylolyticus]AKF09345.1 Putative glycoside hydrolase [Sandaracinus amylolyticus]